MSPGGLVRAAEWEVSGRYTRLPAPDCTLANYVAELFPTRNYSDYSAPLHVIGFPGTESRTTDVRSLTTGHEICRSNIYRAIISYCSRLCGTAGRPHWCSFTQQRDSLFQLFVWICLRKIDKPYNCWNREGPNVGLVQYIYDVWFFLLWNEMKILFIISSETIQKYNMTYINNFGFNFFLFGPT